MYIDPGFNSDATYNVLFKEKSSEESPAQIKAFTDTWDWIRETASGAEAGLAGWVPTMRGTVGTPVCVYWFPLSRGSKTSRRESPRTFQEKTTTNIARPGTTGSQGPIPT